MTATLQKDVYKEFHVPAYHPSVTEVYSNYTSRGGRLCNVPNNETVAWVGFQKFMMDHLVDEWNDTFFNIDKEKAVKKHIRIMSGIMGRPMQAKYLEDLHDLGYLPLEIKALPEGSCVPYQVAPVTFRNTHPNFGWLPNAIETVMSCENWFIQTSCTTSIEYYRRFKAAFEKTGGPMELLPFMCHDFSMRGMMGRHAAAGSGFGHLASGFAGTDSIPAVLTAEEFYGADVDKELVGASVDATEHSVTCSWMEFGEKAFVEYLMSEASPSGILSIVADTWDFWNFVTVILPSLKGDIMARDGQVVVRPDSGDPIKIICGYNVHYGFYSDPLWSDLLVARDGGFEAYYFDEKYYDITTREELQTCEVKGLVECLWDEFGGTVTNKNYKQLDRHIGAIYGDSITLARQEEIFKRLIAKSFVPTVVLGIGSYTFQFVTRDTHGSAVKATNVVMEGRDVPIFKDPKTDSTKKSAKGLLRVEYENDKYVMYDEQTREQEKQGLLETVFLNGEITKFTTLAEIRERIANENYS